MHAQDTKVYHRDIFNRDRNHRENLIVKHRSTIRLDRIKEDCDCSSHGVKFSTAKIQAKEMTSPTLDGPFCPRPPTTKNFCFFSASGVSTIAGHNVDAIADRGADIFPPIVHELATGSYKWHSA